MNNYLKALETEKRQKYLQRSENLEKVKHGLSFLFLRLLYW